MMTRAQRLFAPLAIVAGTALPLEQAFAQEPAPPLPAMAGAPSLPPPPPPPSPGPPGPPTAPPRADVRFDASEPGLRVLALGGEVPVSRVVGYRYGWWVEQGYAPVYSPICSPPCSARLVPSEYRLALAKNAGGAVPASEIVSIAGPSSVHAEYVDRSGLRVAGWVVGVVGTVAGAIMIGASSRGRELVCDSDGNCFSRETFDGGWLAGGIVLVVGSVVTGSILISRRDEAHVTVEPLTLPSVGAAHEAALVAVGAMAPVHGAALSLHF
jgi:hypothetical protein